MLNKLRYALPPERLSKIDSFCKQKSSRIKPEREHTAVNLEPTFLTAMRIYPIGGLELFKISLPSI